MKAKSVLARVLGCLAVLAVVMSHVSAQESPEKLPTKEDLANNNKLFIELATKYLHWDEPTDPIHIVGPLYFVGTRGLSSWLFVTSEGNILLNTGTPKSGPMIVQSIKTLGFKPEDIKIIINGHGHSDHAGAFAYMKQLTGAQIAVMQEDVAMIEDGGKSDFYYGKDWQIMGQPPVKVDRVLRDGDTVRLGEVILTAHHTPGHTKGATTWTTTLVDGGKLTKWYSPTAAALIPDTKLPSRNPTPASIRTIATRCIFWKANIRTSGLATTRNTSISKENESERQPKELTHGLTRKAIGNSSPANAGPSKTR